MKRYDENHAVRKNLIQLTTWLRDNPENFEIVERYYKNVMDDVLVKREAIIVQNGGLIALFVNDVTNKI